MRNSPSAYDMKDFLEKYSDRIADDGDTFKQAIERGVKTATWSTIKTTTWYWTDSMLDHYSKDDRYRMISRHIDDEASTLNRGSTKTLEFDRDEAKYEGKSNGGYYVFHGVVNNDQTDIINDADIEIEVKQKIGSSWSTLKTETFYDVYNHIYINDGSYYGGSYICTTFIEPDDIEDAEWIRVVTKLLNSSDATTIQVHRSEFIEIGK